jgi:hypothetical protein
VVDPWPPHSETNCNRFGFEGIVSKRRSSRYSSGPSHNWIKTKCAEWRRINAERWRIFNQPDQTEGQRALVRKREELARVLEHLGTPGLRPGIVRELRKHVAILEREIAELERASE